MKHLGNKLNRDLSDSQDIDYKKGAFNGSVNKLLGNFGFAQSNVLAKLFGNYCCSFYGSQLWDICGSSIKTLLTAWNKAVRRIYKLPGTCHTRLLPHIMGCLSLKEQLICRFAKFVQNMSKCNNSIVVTVLQNSCSNTRSTLGRNIKYIKHHYNTDILKCNMGTLRNLLECQKDDDVEAGSKGGLVRELCHIRDGEMAADNLELQDCSEIINTVCTD